MWRYWVIGIGGIALALLQNIGLPTTAKEIAATVGGVVFALLGFWLFSEKNNNEIS